MFLDYLDFFYALQIAIFSFTFSVLLTEPKYIFSWYYEFLMRINRKYAKGYFFTYPFGYCEKCLGGQVALWLFLYGNYENYTFNTFISHCLFISLTIYIIHILKLINK